jgi:catechol 2,3-dioxygenase-like lactoylglutathione lyase family enzyme
MQFAHIGFAVKDLRKTKEFYTKALAPLGLALLHETDHSLSFGLLEEEKTMLWLHTKNAPTTPFHICFEADTKDQVDNFYSAALTAGGFNNGAPGVRKDYADNYYAAFVLDPDGHNVEVVFRK